jgi:hypothetical protein
MVKSLQSILNLPYRPDEAAASINQVFFVYPSMPMRRIYVAKLGETSVGMSLVAVRLTGDSQNNSSLQFPVVFTTPVPDASIHNELNKIQSGPYKAPPTAEPAPTSSGMSGHTVLRIQNSTGYELSVYYEGQVSKTLTLSPGATQEVELAPGSFRVGGRVAAPNVVPFYGVETYANSTRYSVEFYLKPNR